MAARTVERPREYPVATMVRAKELAGRGWYATAIRSILQGEGLGSPCVNTIRRWVDPAYDEAQRRRVRTTMARARAASTVSQSGGPKFRLPIKTEEGQQAFMRVLRAEGVSCSAIGKVCGVVFGERLTDNQVRYMLRGVSS
jgi:hypothetical protein